MTTISESVRSCLTQFHSLINSDTISHCSEVPFQVWRDELGRLRVWAANIGAHQTRQSSLDYRLRDASHIRSQIVTLLDYIQDLLTDLKEVLEEGDEDSGSQSSRMECGVDIFKEDNSLVLSSEIQEIHESLAETIGQLYEISMLIRKPFQHDRLLGTNKVDSEPFQFWAKQHVAQKYPQADAVAIDRISSAMARQRAVLKYRERHHEKLSQGIDHPDGKSTMLSETVMTDFGIQEINLVKGGDAISEAGISETSYGGTLLEGTGLHAPRIPPPPKSAENGPFECPFCFYIITARDKRAWARHIFRDLMPYVCIFPDCLTPQKLYESRRQWHHHIQQAHATTASLQRRDGDDDTYNCLICRKGSLVTATFPRHVGQHLEELALFLLPRTGADEDEDEDVVTDEGSEHRSIDDNISDALSSSNSLECLRRGFGDEEPKNNSQHSGISASSTDLLSQEMPSTTDSLSVDNKMWKEEASDTTKEEAIARLEKLILEERTEREARETREDQETANRSSIDQENAGSATRESQTQHEQKPEHIESKARMEAELKAAEEFEDAKKEAEDMAAAAVEAAMSAAKEAAAAEVLAAATRGSTTASPLEKEEPIRFKDAVGRKFTFPFDLCRTWEGMERLISQAFLHIEVIGPHVTAGHYDLIGPSGDIILPQVWETVIEPGDTITMHMWPIPEQPKQPKKPRAKASDPGAFAMWMAGGNLRHNEALKNGKKEVDNDDSSIAGGRVNQLKNTEPSLSANISSGVTSTLSQNTLDTISKDSKAESESSNEVYLPKEPEPNASDPGAFAMWMAGGNLRLNKALKNRKKEIDNDYHQ